jgi:MinD-like ATPase involved in chromosome partitioning or flagellar assembly
VTLDGYDPADANQWSLTPLRTRAVDEQLALNYDHLFTQAFQKSKIGAMEAYTLFNEATNVTLPESVVWPDSDFSRSMQRIAKSIAGHATMGHKRQTFFIQDGITMMRCCGA